MRQQPTWHDNIIKEITQYVKIDQCKKTSDQAEAMRVYAKQAKDRVLLDKAIEVKFAAQVRGGQILISMEERGERATRGGTGANKHKKEQTYLRDTSALKDLGITRLESSRWQILARMPDKQRDARLKQAKSKALAAIDAVAKQLRIELRAADEARVKALKPIEGKFKTIIIDPPWDYEWLSLAGRASPGYATMTHDQLMMLKVQHSSEDDAHCYLWVTNNFMTRGIELMAQYGFQHKTVITWRKLSKKGKPWFGLGSYFRNSTEHVLFGVRGELRTRVGNIPTLFEAKIRDHSEKPDEFYDIVSRASYTPAIEFFQRTPRDNFVNAFQDNTVKQYLGALADRETAQALQGYVA